MAELRCPMCSKINPDTLDVCQFCGARLRPLFLSPTTPLERPAEPGKPATAPAPAPTTPPSSGGTDDWLGQLRGGRSSFDSSSEEPASSPDATEGVDDWLAKLRAQDEFEEPESAPAPPAEAGSVAGGAGAKSSDQNDWLGSLRASGSEAPSWLSEPVEPEPQKDDVNWLQTSGSADETLVSKGKQLAAEPQAEVALPDWLQESGRIGDTSVGLQPPAAEVALPDRLSESAAPPAPTTPPGQTAILETDWVDSTLSDATSSLPDWLKPPGSADETIVSKGKQPVAKPSTPDWLQPSSAAETPAPAEAPQESSLPNWLDSPVIKKATGPIEAQPPTQPPAPTTPSGEKSVVGTTDWLAKFSTEQQQPITAPEVKKTGVTGWLSSLTPDQVAETPPATPPGEKAVVGITDWLASTDDPIPASAELPDWLKGSEPPAPPTQPPAPITPPGEKPVVGTTDWLAKFSADQQQPVTPPEVKKTGVTGWLSSLTPDQVAETPTTTPPSEKSVVGTTDWLAKFSAEQQQPVTPPEAKKTGVTGWLSSLTPDQVAETPPTPPATPPDDKAVVGITDWLASTDDTVPTSTELPDWFQGSEPSAQPPAPAAPPRKKAVVGTTDWFASTEAADESALAPAELPDWLKGSEPSAQPPAPATPPGEKSTVGTTDWLAKFSAAQQQPVTPLEAKKTGVTSWLSSLTPDQVTETPPTTPPGEKAVVGTTDWFASTEPVDESVPTPVALPDWLSAPSEPSTPPASATPPGGKPVVGTTDWLKSSVPGETPSAPTVPAKKTGATGWLSSPAPQQPPAQAAPPPAPAKRTGTTGWLSSEFDQVTKPDWVIGGEAPAAETPDWVKSTPTPAGTPPPSAPTSGSAVVGTTDWLKSFESPEKAASISAFDASSLGKDLRKSDVSDLDWLTAIQPPSTPAPPPAPARPPTGPLTTAPARTSTGPLLGTPPTKGTGPLGATTTRRATGPLAALPTAESGIEAADLPPWLAALRPTGLDLGTTSSPFTETPEVATEEIPEWVKPLAAEASARGPDETIPGAPPFTTPPFTTTASLAAVPAFTEAHGAAEEDLAQANLPSWMRNLRPLTVRAMAREVDLDRTESTGPLAGMRGVLPAESVIAVAGTPGAAVMRFILSAAQERRADLLRTLVQEETAEEAEIQPRKRKPFIYSFDRLLVALALLAAVVIPTLTATYLPEQYATFAGLFPSPSISASAQPLKDKIDGLPTDRPAVALVAFEYEPGYIGELNPGVASVLVQLMKHGVSVAAVSTYPTGPRVAQNVLDEVAAEVGLTDGYGKNYINLGYIPGGVLGLQQFATDPTNTVTRDFRDGTDPWKGDVLKDFNELGKFNLIIVTSASADSVQRWIEQVKRDGQPMAAVTSAAAEPLVAPYASGDNPQLTALVSGLSGAIGYDEATQRKSDAAAQTAVRWSSYAFGLYTSAGALAVGAVFSAAALILASRTALPKKARPAAKAGPAASAGEARKPTTRRTTTKRKGAAAKSKAAKPRLRQK